MEAELRDRVGEGSVLQANFLMERSEGSSLMDVTAHPHPHRQHGYRAVVMPQQGVVGQV